MRVVRRSQCLHRASRKLLAQAWQTRACDPSTGPDRAGMLRGVVSRECHDWFSELADITVAVAHAPGLAAVLRPVAAEKEKEKEKEGLLPVRGLNIPKADSRSAASLATPVAAESRADLLVCIFLSVSSKCCAGWPRGPGSRPNPHGRGPSALKL